MYPHNRQGQTNENLVIFILEDGSGGELTLFILGLADDVRGSTPLYGTDYSYDPPRLQRQGSNSSITEEFVQKSREETHKVRITKKFNVSLNKKV